MASSKTLYVVVGALCFASVAVSVFGDVVTVLDTIFLDSADPDDINFMLYNDKTNASNYQNLTYGDLSTISASKYDPTRITKFIIHGFSASGFDGFPQNLKNAYLNASQDYNIIVVNWGLLAMPKIEQIYPVFYPFVVNNVYTCGTRVADFIIWLQKASLIDPSRTHIIGHSLGAHISGRAARTVNATLNQLVARATGLDPAGPLFYTNLYGQKLAPTDARFVDAYHTNAGELGIWEPVAQVDFFVNGGGGPQPGCVLLDTPSAIFGTVTETAPGICSHTWATYFYSNTVGNGTLREQDTKQAASTNLLSFTLNRSTKYVTLGEYMSNNVTGAYFLKYDYTMPA